MYLFRGALSNIDSFFFLHIRLFWRSPKGKGHMAVVEKKPASRVPIIDMHISSVPLGLTGARRFARPEFNPTQKSSFAHASLLILELFLLHVTNVNFLLLQL